ncbi:CotS family spore coat protein [Bacillus solimangrovi]|uniref:Spore coat protein n=1 Tax=Bacillus solimangrovi TaxID=1305675 RepID=A0A1E5LG38_9BACI|nr:CotS family spore coat protein [Bacillus solimangrovi]OEH93047.1 spore coat protein [Bacillus solimangrovi]
MQLEDDNILKRVLDCYSIQVENVKLLTSKSGRTTWLIETSDGEKILKNAQMKPTRMLFIAEAHEHLHNNGLPIAKIHRTTQGGLCVGVEDSAFVLYDKVDGNEVIYYDKEQLTRTMKFMAQFHTNSQGFVHSDESKKRGRIGKWQKLYRWKLQELEGNKSIAQGLPLDPFSLMFLSHVDKMLERGRQSLMELDEAAYQNWSKEWIEAKGFCQQDFTMARLIDTEDDLFMRELHSITIDLPSRDIRMLMNKVMKKLSIWDTDLAIQMLQAYDSINPLTEDQYKVLWTDLKFPHLFCSIIHKYYLGQKVSWSDEKYIWALQNIIAVENSKAEFTDQFHSLVPLIKEKKEDS